MSGQLAAASSPEERGNFAAFAATADRVSATSSRLEKAAALAAYFTGLSEPDLLLAARFFSGTVFSQRDQRTTSVGGAAIMAALAAVAGVEEDGVRARLVALGDLGDVAGELLQAQPGVGPRLTLQQAEAEFAALAAASGGTARREQVERLLRSARGLEARYLVKLLLSDLRIGLQEGAVEDAIARWAGVPVAKVQWANMLLGDIGETAVRALRQALDNVPMRLFHPLKFMLASPAADLEEVASTMPAEFAVEDKYDGIRVQAHVAFEVASSEPMHGVVKDGVRVALFSRTLDEITEGYPELVDGLAAICPSGGMLLDGEILPVQGESVLPFQALQRRLGRKKPTPAMLTETPVALLAYDVLFAGDELLVERPLAERRGWLERLVPAAGPIRISPQRLFSDAMELDAEFAAARARGNEGLMVKDPASPYKPGRRGRSWLKVKRALATLDVVVTAVEVGNGRRRNLLSDYTFAVRTSETDPALLTIGKAYSGLTDAELAEMSEWFRAHTLAEFAHGKVRVVEPRVVIEVTFDRIQRSKRHRGGYALRFPRIARLRLDKPPSEIDTLETVKAIADSLEGVANPSTSDETQTPEVPAPAGEDVAAAITDAVGE